MRTNRIKYWIGAAQIGVLVANQGTPRKPGKTVSFIDLGTFKVVATIETGPGAHGVVIGRDGRRALVTNSYANTASVIDVAERKVIATVPVGKGPNGISMAPRLHLPRHFAEASIRSDQRPRPTCLKR